MVFKVEIIFSIIDFFFSLKPFEPSTGWTDRESTKSEKLFFYQFFAGSDSSREANDLFSASDSSLIDQQRMKKIGED